MGNFVVSARKYRPQKFSRVIGQEALTGTLCQAIKTGKLASAYLFCGPRGVGKTTCARIFAKAINCVNPDEEGEACGECESCRSFNEGRSLNVQELNASANNSVDDIRLIIDQVRIPPQSGKYKVIILDEVHMLSASASNALLKTLEEPPSYVIFILATTEKQKLLPTILSRCQIFDFNRMTVGNIVEELKLVAGSEGIECEESALGIIARKADGGMRDALSIFDQVANYAEGKITYDSALEVLNVLDCEYYFRMTDLLLSYKVGEALLLLDEIIRKGFDAGIFIGGLAGHLRDLLVSRDKVTLPLLDVGEDLRDRYADQAQKADEDFFFRAMHVCDECSNGYRNAFNKRLSVELALIEVAQSAAGRKIEKKGDADRPLQPLLRDTNAASAVAASSQAQPKRQPAADKPQVGSAGSQVLKERQAQQTSMPRIPSIHGAGRSKRSAAAEEKDEASGDDDGAGAALLTEESLRQAWGEYVEKNVEDESVRKLLATDAVRLEGEDGVVLEVPNTPAGEFVSGVLRSLEKHLAGKFSRSGIKVRSVVRAFNRSSEPHTPGEIFSDMLGRSETLRRLKKELGLELD